MKTRSGREVLHSFSDTQQVSFGSSLEKPNKNWTGCDIELKETGCSDKNAPSEKKQTTVKSKPVEGLAHKRASGSWSVSHAAEIEHLSDVTDDVNSLDDRSFVGDDQFSNISESSSEDIGTESNLDPAYSVEKRMDGSKETLEFLKYQQAIVKDMFSSCGAVGLKNLGNTCFVNSVLQALSNTERFRRFVLVDVEDDLLSSVEKKQNEDRQVSMVENDNKESELKVFVLKELRELLKSLWGLQKYSSNSGNEEQSQVMSRTEQTLERNETNDTAQVFYKSRHSLKRKRSNTNFVSPDGFLNAVWSAIPPFRALQQADAQEFLHLMLNRVHFETTHLYSNASNRKWEEITDSTKSSVRTIFGGCIQTITECMSCGEVSRKEQDFLDLSLHIPKEFIHFAGRRSARLSSFHTQDSEMTEKVTCSYKTNQLSCSLYQCLELFTEKELLAQGNRYLCPKCNEYVNAWRRCKLAKLPEVLCVHLSRVYPTQRNRSPMKVDTHVDFPLTDLYLDKYVVEDMSLSSSDADHTNLPYDLCAVIQHHGSGWLSGHYTAFCKHVSGQWYHFNDVNVELVDSKKVSQSEAYILLYSRRTVENMNKSNIL